MTFYVDQVSKTVGICSKHLGAFRELLSYCSYLYYLRFSIYCSSRVHPPLIVINHSSSSETFHSIIFPTYYIYFPFSRSYLRRSHRVRLRYLLSFVTYTYSLNIPAALLNYLQVFRATRAHTGKNTFPLPFHDH